MKPEEEALAARIRNQISWRGPTDTVALIWHGYLTALLEWGLIDVSVFDRLVKYLPKKGLKELHEMCLDEPIKPEYEKEIDGYMNNCNEISHNKKTISDTEKLERDSFCEWMKYYFEKPK